MSQLAHKIDDVLNRIILKSEKNLELLVGQCKSEANLTNTQEHILMLIAEGTSNNAELAKALNISQAAVTKAIKTLKEQGMLETKETTDARMVQYALTDLAKPIAEEHAHHHDETVHTYEHVLQEFTLEEQQTIERFLTHLIAKIEGKS